MQAVKMLYFFLAVFLPISSLAAPDEPVLDERALYESCSEFSQAGIRECLGEKAQNSEWDLQAAQEQMLGFLSRWDSDENRYILEAKINFNVSNETFSSYREAHCAFSASLSGGGNGRSITYPGCITELNNRHAVRLHALRVDPAFTKPVASNPDERTLIEACGVSSHAEKRACLGKKAQESQQALQEVGEQLLAALSEWREDDRYLLEAKIKLVVSNQVFASHREAHCAFTASASRGDNDERIVYPACVATLSERRAVQLRDAVSDLHWRAEFLRDTEEPNSPLK